MNQNEMDDVERRVIMSAVGRPKTTKVAKVCWQQTHNNSFGFIIKSVTGNL